MTEHNDKNQVIIIGGGLAGLVSAIHLSKKGLQVLVIEKNTYPNHKVCGEYVSNEVLPYLESIGFIPDTFDAKKIKKIDLSSTKSNSIQANLPLGGFSISRYTLDHELAKNAIKNGVTISIDTVVNIEFKKDTFFVYTKNNEIHTSRIAIGAYGKRANIDVKLKRTFIQNDSPYLAIKGHYKGDFPEDLVGLHNFKGGYCGVSKIENNHINICYITTYKSFKKYKNIDDFQDQVLCQNIHLKKLLKNTEVVFSKPISISQISFSSKNLIEQHILMCGDTAGMIHPLCGNGMGMAIHAAQILSTLILEYFNNKAISRQTLEKKYTLAWEKEFGQRLKMGRILAVLFRINVFSELVIWGLKIMPWLLPLIIKRTHGKPLKPLTSL
ncbi:NAD(P)/FAD-dependent oxidoreductase [Aquimarina sp. 2201CG1-2-11]|uniref:NAD(P)/FAD-dependent oxidoreductase n=1 Tax=Aquimarina discodermiae TaxID=3231043 RepID=UPI003462D97F